MTKEGFIKKWKPRIGKKEEFEFEFYAAIRDQLKKFYAFEHPRRNIKNNRADNLITHFMLYEK